MTKQVGACCSLPAAICYWFIVSLIAWGVLSLIGIYWRPLNASSAATCLFAMAIGCLANWLRNRSFHCAITGPLFLIGGVMFLLSGVLSILWDYAMWRGDVATQRNPMELVKIKGGANRVRKQRSL